MANFIQKYKGILRKFKPTYVLYNLLQRDKLVKNKALYDKYGIKKSIFSPISHKDIKIADSDIPWLDRADAKELLAKNEEKNSFPISIQNQFEKWIDNGYIILENFFSEKQIDETYAEIELLFKQQIIDYNYTGGRIMDAFRKSKKVNEIMRDKELLRLISFLLGRETDLFQTINFFEGSQQNPHSDFIHMSTEPKGYLVGVWVALEDIDTDAGPVYYYPGSHRLPYIFNEDFDTGNTSLWLGNLNYTNYEIQIQELIKEHNLKPVEFTAKKGDVLIWHANLIHGGKKINRKGSTRKSLVGHYFSKGVLCYHEITERPAIIY
jgi:ectoine hydroxylase-related dioxygenase (phytanoyl-CoA dioxygenase family)